MPETLKDKRPETDVDRFEHDTEELKKAALKERIDDIRTQVIRFVNDTYYHLGAAGSAETALLESGVAYIKEDDEKEIKGWEQYVHGEMQKQREAAFRLYENMLEQLDKAVTQGVMTEEGKKRWIDRFRDPGSSYKRKEYFVKNELPRRIENLKGATEERSILLKKSGIKKLSNLPEYQKLVDEKVFAALSYNEKKHVVSLLEMMLNHPERNEIYVEAVRKKLTLAAQQGYLSPNKVGTWLKRIFQEQHSLQSIESFLSGSGGNSLSGLINNWKQVTKQFDTVDAELGKSENIARGFRRVARKDFLDMHYDQRVSYVREAERVLETSVNIDKENPRLLKIRHYLDIEDWDAADDEIKKAQQENLQGADFQRLQSMRDYLKGHRNDGGTQKETINMDAIRAAQAGVDSVLDGMDSSLRALTERLLKHGNSAINNLRWTMYNYVWCNKNGYIDQQKSQERANTHRESTKEHYKRQEDVGTNDVAIDGGYLRSDDHMKEGMKQGKSKATYQIANLENPNVRSSLESYYAKSHDTKVLYWTSLVATDSQGNTKSDGWHQQAFSALNQLRTHTRTLENAGLRWRGYGVSLRSISQSAPDVKKAA